MKKILYTLIAYSIFMTLLTSSVLPIAISDDSNRNTLNTQSIRDRSAHRTMFNALIHAGRTRKKMEKDKSTGFTFSVTPLAAKCFSSDRLGAYFGVDDSNRISLEYQGSSTRPGTGIADVGLMIRDSTNGTSTTGDSIPVQDSATITLNPSSLMYGANFDVCLGLDRIAQGLSLRAGTAVASATNSLGFNIIGGVKSANGPDSVSDFLTGNGSSAVQNVVAKAKMLNTTDSVIDLADIQARIEYCFSDQKYNRFTAYLGGLIPTGSKSTSDILFEPLVGTHNTRIEAGISVWGNVFKWGNDRSIDLNLNGSVAYGFASTQTRVVDLRTQKWSRYHLTLEKGKPFATTDTAVVTSILHPFVPLANILSQEVKVKPRAIVDVLLNMTYTHQTFFLDISYHYLFKQKESNSLKNEWEDRRFYRLSSSAPWRIGTSSNISNRGFGPEDPTNTTFFTPVNLADLDLNHPMQAFSTIGICMGSVHRESETPWGIGIGCSMTLVNNAQTTPSSIDGFASLGINF